MPYYQLRTLTRNYLYSPLFIAQAKALLQIGFTSECFRVFRAGDDFEHNSQQELGLHAPESAGEMRAQVRRDLRRVDNEVDAYEGQRQRIGLGRSDYMKLRELWDRQRMLRQMDAHLTKMVGEGRDTSGTWHGTSNPKGLAARCALRVMKARGPDPDATSSEVPSRCTHEACDKTEHLAICYYCVHALVE